MWNSFPRPIREKLTDLSHVQMSVKSHKETGVSFGESNLNRIERDSARWLSFLLLLLLLLLVSSCTVPSSFFSYNHLRPLFHLRTSLTCVTWPRPFKPPSHLGLSDCMSQRATACARLRLKLKTPLRQLALHCSAMSEICADFLLNRSKQLVKLVITRSGRDN